MIKRLWRECSY